MNRKRTTWLVSIGVAAAAIGGLLATRQSWGPVAASWLDPTRSEAERGQPVNKDGHQDAQTSRIELSEQAQQNIGLKTIDLKPATFSRTITVPGIVTEKPGHSDVEVTTQLAGVITQVYPLRGETVEPGDPLFRLRLTHEEIVQAQANLLRTAEELDVVAREIARLEKVTEGAIPGKNLLERKYDQQKLQAAQHAQKQALVLHGLSEEQVEGILRERRLLKEVILHAPGGTATGERKAETEPLGDAVQRAVLEKPPGGKVDPGPAPNAQVHRHSDLVPPRPRRFFELETLTVEQGQHVEVGRPLCKLGDHTSLYIEGRAFERDAQLLTNATAQGWPVAAAFDSGSEKPEILSNLQIVYLANAVDKESRAFPFYVELRNEIARDARTSEGHRFLSWKYKPGQRVQLLVPIEQWANRLVVPAEAVVQDGAETYVFQRNGDLFERRTVHLEYQDQRSAVLANDGSVFPGEHIVVTGAYQLHLAIKNKTGGGADPHAGHRH